MFKYFQQNPKKSLDQKLTPKKSHAKFLTLKTLNITNSMFVYVNSYTQEHLAKIINMPQESLLKSSHPNKYLPNFPTPKNPRIKNFKPSKILLSSPSHEIPSTPPPCLLGKWIKCMLFQSSARLKRNALKTAMC